MEVVGTAPTSQPLQGRANLISAIPPKIQISKSWWERRTNGNRTRPDRLTICNAATTP